MLQPDMPSIDIIDINNNVFHQKCHLLNKHSVYSKEVSHSFVMLIFMVFPPYTVGTKLDIYRFSFICSIEHTLALTGCKLHAKSEVAKPP